MAAITPASELHLTCADHSGDVALSVTRPWAMIRGIGGFVPTPADNAQTGHRPSSD